MSTSSIAEQIPHFSCEDTEDGMWIVTCDGARIIGSPEFSDEAMAQDYCEGKREAAEQAAVRAAMVAGVRALADFLEEHPDVPVYSVWAWSHPKFSTDPDAALAEAIALRELTGAEVKDDYGSSLKLTRVFGGDVEWHATVAKEKVAVPRVEGRKVVWDIAPQLAAPDAAESGEEA